MSQRKRHHGGGRILWKICLGMFGAVIVQGIPVQLTNSGNAGEGSTLIQHIADFTLPRKYDRDGAIPGAMESNFFDTVASLNFAAGLETRIDSNQLNGQDGSALQIAVNDESSWNSQDLSENEVSQLATVESIIAKSTSGLESDSLTDKDIIANLINSNRNLNNLLLLNGNPISFENAGQFDSDTLISLLAYAPANLNEDAGAQLNASLFGSLFRDPLEEEFKEEHEWINGDLPLSVLSESEQKCLAEAVYFEARSESVEGQVAVAQVVLNRTLAPRYPDTICEVVYQNQHRLHKCQFSFACDGVSESVHSISAWRRAEKIAENVTYGISHLNSVGKSTHYHADYVRPVWARAMDRQVKIGLHIFYTTKLDG